MDAGSLQELRQEQQRARRMRRTWEAALSGRSSLVAPLSANRQAGGVAQAAISADTTSAAAGSGIALVLGRSSPQTIPVGGAALSLTEAIIGPARTGVEVPALPATSVQVPAKSVVSVLVRFAWVGWRAGGVVRLKRGSVVVDEAPSSWGTRFDGVLHAGAVEPGEALSVEVDHEDGADHDLTDVRVDLRVEGPARGIVSDFTGAALYAVLWNPSSPGGPVFRIARETGAGETTLASSAPADTGTAFVGIRALVVGGRIRARVWPWADPEPSTWNLDVTDPAPLPAGVVGVTSTVTGSIGSPGTYREYDYLEVANDGAPAVATDFSEYPDGGLPADWSVLVGAGGPSWEIATGGALYIGEKLLRYPTQSVGVGAYVGWDGGGIGFDVDALLRARNGQTDTTVGLVLRGNPLA